MNCLIIKMGGSGQRFGQELPKQFTLIKNKPYFSYIFEDCERIATINKFIVVTNIDFMDITTNFATRIFKDKLLGVIAGGNSNLQSTYNGIKFATQYLTDNDILLTHDITNSSIDEEAICKVIAAAKEFGAATIGTEQVQTLFKREGDILTDTITKSSVASGYTPEAYNMSIIKSCFEKTTEEDLMNMTSPLATIIANGYTPRMVLSNILPLKLTYTKDLETFMKLHGLWDWSKCNIN